MPRREDAELARLNTVKRREHRPAHPLGVSMISFFKKEVQKRQTRLTQIAAAWNVLIPQDLLEHCCLESFSGGSLKVLVDSSAHLYQLKLLLSGGVEKQLKLTSGVVGLRKVTLKQGQWYEGDGAERKIKFD